MRVAQSKICTSGYSVSQSVPRGTSIYGSDMPYRATPERIAEEVTAVQIE